MKSKLTIKVLGVVVTLATLASLVVGLTAAPVSAAVTNQMVFTPISMPSNINNTLGGVTHGAITGSDVTNTTFTALANPHLDAVAASADGMTLYAWDNTNTMLYESINGGKSWPNMVGIKVDPTATFIGMEVSPTFATDGYVTLVTSKEVWLISGGVNTVSNVTSNLPAMLETGGTITSFDFGPYYSTNTLSIFIGVTGGAGAVSNVLYFPVNSFTWNEIGTGTGALKIIGTVTAVGAAPAPTGAPALGAGGSFTVAETLTLGVGSYLITTPAGAALTAGTATVTSPILPITTGPGSTTVAVSVAGTLSVAAPIDPSVVAIKISPNFLADADIMALFTNGINTYLGDDIGTQGWNNSALLPAVQVGTGMAANALNANTSIMVGTDYIGNSTGTILIGSTTGGTTTGLWRISNHVGTSTPTVSNITATAVNHIAVSGPLTSANVVASQPGNTNLMLFTNITSTSPTAVTPAQYRYATGTDFTSLQFAGANKATLFAGTKGPNSAVNVSADYGVSFNQLGLMDMGATAFSANTLTYSGFAQVSATNWYVIVKNSIAANGNGLFQSADKGVTWTRIFGSAWGLPAQGVNSMARSPSFATDNTFILYNGSGVKLGSGFTNASPFVLLTTDGGKTYSTVVEPIGITSLTMVANGQFLCSGGTLSGSATFYRSGVYNNATFTPALGVPIRTFAQSKKDTTGMTIAAGTMNGQVYQSTDGGATFTQLGTFPAGSGDQVSVAYAADGTLWAAPTGLATDNKSPASTRGIYHWVPATSQWLNIETSFFPSSITISTDGTMYCAGDFATAGPVGQGIFRSLDYNAFNSDGSTNSHWAQINGTTFTGGSSTVSVGTPYNGYPGTGANAVTSQSSVSVTSAATGNTLYITESTSNVTNSMVTNVIYSFVDSFIVGPAITAPKTGTVLATDTYATMTWTGLNGPAGGSATSNTNYVVQLTTAKNDFTGTTVPVYGPPNMVNTTLLPSTIVGTSGLDNYGAGSTTQTVNVNPVSTTLPLKTGTTYYWEVLAYTPIPSRATIASFTTAVSTINPTPTVVNATPAQGATNVDVATSFTWPGLAPITGQTITYDIRIAAERGTADKFAVLDYTATTTTNAYIPPVALEYSTQYWWEVRANTATSSGAFTVFTFTTEPKVATSTATGTNTTPVTTTIVVSNPPQPTPTVTVNIPPQNQQEVIPSYLLWAVIAVGAILIIAVIVLIVRTRRIS